MLKRDWCTRQNTQFCGLVSTYTVVFGRGKKNEIDLQRWLKSILTRRFNVQKHTATAYGYVHSKSTFRRRKTNDYNHSYLLVDSLKSHFPNAFFNFVWDTLMAFLIAAIVFKSQRFNYLHFCCLSIPTNKLPIKRKQCMHVPWSRGILLELFTNFIL